MIDDCCGERFKARYSDQLSSRFSNFNASVLGRPSRYQPMLLPLVWFGLVLSLVVSLVLIPTCLFCLFWWRLDLRPTFPEISLQLKDETLLSMPEDDPPKVLGKSGDFGGGKHHTQVHLRKKMDVSFPDAKAPLLSPHSVLETKLSPSTSTSTSTTMYGTIAATATSTPTSTTGLVTAILPASDEHGEEENDSLLSDGDEAMPS